MAGTPTVFTVEQSATFNTIMLIGVEPKMAFKSDQQETARDGRKKWEVHVSAAFSSFGKTEYTMLKVNVLAESDPGEGINPGTPVQLLGFQVGVQDKVVKDKDTGESKAVGAQVWYRADEMRSTASTGPQRASSKAAEKSATAEVGA